MRLDDLILFAAVAVLAFVVMPKRPASAGGSMGPATVDNNPATALYGGGAATWGQAFANWEAGTGLPGDPDPGYDYSGIAADATGNPRARH